MSARYGFLASRRWLGVAGLAVVVAGVCTMLGFWQWQRHEARAAAIAVVAANTTQAPVSIGDLLSSPEMVVGDAVQWRAVALTGRYVGAPVALPQRGLEASPADHALAVLDFEGPDGQTWLIVVDRGSYPTDAFVDPTNRLATPSGEVTLVLRLRPAEPSSPREPIPGQVFRIAPSQVWDSAVPDGDPRAGALVQGAYGWLVSETPTTVEPPTPLPVPEPNYRSNLSYALQWWTFGLMAFVGFGVLARRERLTLDLAAGMPTPQIKRRVRDADVEDADLDAAEAQARQAAQARPAAQASETSSA